MVTGKITRVFLPGFPEEELTARSVTRKIDSGSVEK